ncbi:MAG: YceD family protein [Gammaproteobacteria bacterium]|nr:YceD family protein [Gammaproteobacteria bacterium]
MAAGQVIVQGRMSTTLAQVCRRCLEPVAQPFALPIRFVFVPDDEPGSEDDGEVRTFPAHLADLDIGGPLVVITAGDS